MAHRQDCRLDDLRRFGTALASRVGLPPARASSFVTGLLWYDAADAPSFGIASLPLWLGAVDRGEIDPKAEGKIVKEHTATAVLDGGRGVGPLILARAAMVAQEKAREVGVGVVRVVNVGRTGATAEVASEIAIGPMVGTVRGPSGAWSAAVPVSGSVPVVFDTALGVDRDEDPTSPVDVPDWTSLVDIGDGWVVMARAVGAFESLASLQEQAAAMLANSGRLDGEVRPADWQARRLEHLERGLSLDESARRGLREWGERLGVAWPEGCRDG